MEVSKWGSARGKEKSKREWEQLSKVVETRGHDESRRLKELENRRREKDSTSR
jgi:hypothetical protein